MITMKRVRGPDRRKWSTRTDWGLKLPDGFVERRHQVERRMPDVAEISLDEFEKLVKSGAASESREREAADSEIDSASAPAPGTQVQDPLPSEPDENG